MTDRKETEKASGCVPGLSRRPMGWIMAHLTASVKKNGSCHLFRARSTEPAPVSASSLVGEIMTLVREPDAGNPPVRFDERGVETKHGQVSEAPADERAGNR